MSINYYYMIIIRLVCGVARVSNFVVASRNDGKKVWWMLSRLLWSLATTVTVALTGNVHCGRSDLKADENKPHKSFMIVLSHQTCLMLLLFVMTLYNLIKVWRRRLCQVEPLTIVMICKKCALNRLEVYLSRVFVQIKNAPFNFT